MHETDPETDPATSRPVPEGSANGKAVDDRPVPSQTVHGRTEHGQPAPAEPAPADPAQEHTVHGQTVDDQTRCAHYRTERDVVAIKFVCCERFYPCYQCHAAAETHPARQWPADRWAEHAILCGACGDTLSIADYRETDRCPRCDAAFNDGCRTHAHLYFDVPEALA
ncbi:CHY zinc finger protein [Cryobacterium sp. TMT2-23]|uniref:CHY zinc finger protein n=1 Tax=Cryobacterium sp. TMT2-23 TaxID=1259252 RepID=UPI001069983C|nr:hypothetical protein E3T32_07975 [Cryobacterium sp. TMT2-23]